MSFLNTFWNYLLATSPYLLLGFFISGLVRAFLSVDLIKKKLGKRDSKTVFLASLVGVPLPICSCSVIPAAVTLKQSGASNGATSSFVISTPETGIDSISITYALMDLPMMIIRPIVAFFTAFTAGIIQNHINDFEPESIEEKKSCCSKGKKKTEKNVLKRLWSGLKYAFTDLINDISVWLFIGLVAGAAISFFIPEGFFESFDGWTGRFVVLLIGLPLYICAAASTPIAVSFVLKGMSPGSALIFLLVGPATNFSNMAVLQKYIGKKGVMINNLVIMVVSLIASYLVDLYYGDGMPSWKMGGHHDHGFGWFSILSSILLLGLLIRGIYVKKIKRFL